MSGSSIRWKAVTAPFEQQGLDGRGWAMAMAESTNDAENEPVRETQFLGAHACVDDISQSLQLHTVFSDGREKKTRRPDTIAHNVVYICMDA